MENCIFCRIIRGEIPATMLFENDFVVAFRDIEAQAPVHVLIVPKQHVGSVLDADSQIFAQICDAAVQIAKLLNLTENGFRLVVNTGKDAQQSVQHLHMHLLAGRTMQWPPG